MAVLGQKNEGDMYAISGSISRLCTWWGRLNVVCFGQGECFRCRNVKGPGNPVHAFEERCVEDFKCFLDESLVLGAFRRVDFTEGDEITVIASDRYDGALWANAVVRESDGFLWMPYAASKGRRAIALWTGKLMLVLLLIGEIGMCFLSLFRTLSLSYFEEAALNFLGLALFFALVGFLGYRCNLPDGLYGEAIMKQLGFRNPKIVDLDRFAIDIEAGIYDLRKALRAYDSLDKHDRR